MAARTDEARRPGNLSAAGHADDPSDDEAAAPGGAGADEHDDEAEEDEAYDDGQRNSSRRSRGKRGGKPASSASSSSSSSSGMVERPPGARPVVPRVAQSYEVDDAPWGGAFAEHAMAVAGIVALPSLTGRQLARAAEAADAARLALQRPGAAAVDAAGPASRFVSGRAEAAWGALLSLVERYQMTSSAHAALRRRVEHGSSTPGERPTPVPAPHGSSAGAAALSEGASARSLGNLPSAGQHRHGAGAAASAGGGSVEPRPWCDSLSRAVVSNKAEPAPEGWVVRAGLWGVGTGPGLAPPRRGDPVPSFDALVRQDQGQHATG